MANVVTNEEEKRRTLFVNSKDMLRCVYKKCKEESVSGLQIPLELYEERVMYYTEAPTYLLEEISKDNLTTNYLDLFERAIISDALIKLYKLKKPFSFRDIYLEVRLKVKNSELTAFCRDLRSLGYEHFNTLNYGRIVLEEPKLTFERFKYLNKIRKLRSMYRTVYYLDERIIDLSRSYKKPWLINADTSQIDGYIFFHIVSNHGYEKGLFCNQANAEDFRKWVNDMVLPSLNPSSIIIMDKSQLHGETVNGPISRYHSKDDMLKWLQHNNIPCTSSMRKAQLYDLIARCPFKDPQYNIDLIFKSHGHEVLRLPDKYHDLSLTELMWEHLNVAPYTDTDKENVLNLKRKILAIITTIPRDTWGQFESTIEATEKKFFDIDESIEEALSSYDIDLKDLNTD